MDRGRQIQNQLFTMSISLERLSHITQNCISISVSDGLSKHQPFGCQVFVRYISFHLLQLIQMDELIHNPYKVSSPMDKNCIIKAAVSYVMGGGMGLIMAMFMNAVEMREIQVGKVRRSTPIVLRKDWRRIWSTGKGFATFGGFFVLFQCMIEHVRGKDDGINSFFAGASTSMILGANVMKPRQLLWSGMGGGAMCYAFYKVFKMLGY